MKLYLIKQSRFIDVVAVKFCSREEDWSWLVSVFVHHEAGWWCLGLGNVCGSAGKAR